MEEDRRPKLKPKVAPKVLKVLTKKLAPTENIGNYNSGKKATKRLMEFKDWVSEFEKFEQDFTTSIGGGPQLF